jgi:phosphopantetheinyl transferase
MKILINPIKGLTGETTMTLLTHNNNQYENIHRKLSTFMERKRLQFQRFYFLEDREMMELLAGLAKDSSLHRMFEGITGWY